VVSSLVGTVLDGSFVLFLAGGETGRCTTVVGSREEDGFDEQAEP
jgi:hypothetical protein